MTILVSLLAAMLIGVNARGPADPPQGEETTDETTLTAGDEGRRSMRVFGLTFVTDDDPYCPPAEMRDPDGKLPERIVVLIHGLDDPGWMWRDMIPALREAGHIVARFEYPNDGPISEAADLMALSLTEIRLMGVQRVDVVAHSMGGLVTRDLLTRESYYGGDGAGRGRFPALDRFIMCGTPNHGSELVRLRAVSEIKEQITRAFSGEGEWLGSLADGSGEAAVDLLPGSDFLRRLNQRPLATHTRHIIIAGRMSPVRKQDVNGLAGKVRQFARSSNAPNWLRSWIDVAEEQTASLLDETVRGLGDGCVSLDSAKLTGVEDITIVEANHVGLIVNIIANSDNVPPAIPIVLDRLGVPAEDGSERAKD
ncbi:MAG: alpha/beta fold hydrolase [Phycisphaerales bacterium]|nr:MAG: alpha/beta fold hydrolase [Phycisphaerales bacterium]